MLFLLHGAVAFGQPVASAQPDGDRAEVESSAQSGESSVDPSAGDGEVLFDFLRSEVDTVELASKRAQSLYDAPADVTVIDRSYIESVHVENPAELLRRAPGVLVVEPSGGSYNVGQRGINRLGNNYTLVMIDGRKIASFTLGYIPWGAMPIDTGDLERIEVLQGPGSTLYGANALSGVVNLVTKRPLDYVGAEGRVAAGAYLVSDFDREGDDRTKVFNGGNGYAAYSWGNESRTLGARLSTGFQTAPDWDADPVLADPKRGDYHYHVSLAGEWRKGDSSIVLSGSHTTAERDLIFTTAAEPLSYLYSEQVVSVNARQDNMLNGLMSAKLLAGFRHDEQTAGSFREDRGSTLEFSPNNIMVYASAQTDLSLWRDRNLLTIGVDLERQVTEGAQFGLDAAASYIAAVAQNEFVVLEKPRLLASLGLRAEQVEFDNQEGDIVVYRNLNPRGALVLNFDDRHSIRAVSASAYRTPPVTELFQRGILDNGDPDVPNGGTILPNLGLRPSRSVDFELGYRGRPVDQLTINTSLFYQRINDYTDLNRELRFPVRYQNLFDIDNVGASAELTYAITGFGTAWGHYTYSRTTEGDSGDLLRDWPAHVAAVGGNVALFGDVRLSGQVSFWSETEPEVITRTNRSQIDLANETVPAQAAIDARIAHTIFDGGGEIFGAVHNALGAVRERDDLRRYVTDIVEPIGASVLVGIRFSEKKRQTK